MRKLFKGGNYSRAETSRKYGICNLLWNLVTTEKVYHFINGTTHPYFRPNSPTKKDDTIEVHLNQDDVQVTLTDEHGNPLPLKDVDLQLKLPAKCKDTSFKGF